MQETGKEAFSPQLVLKTLSVGPARARTLGLPHDSLVQLFETVLSIHLNLCQLRLVAEVYKDHNIMSSSL